MTALALALLLAAVPGKPYMGSSGSGAKSPPVLVATTWHSGGWSNLSPNTTTFSTAGTNRLLVMACAINDYGTTLASIGPVTGATLSWTNIIDIYTTNGSGAHTMVWIAWASAQVTGETVTVPWTPSSQNTDNNCGVTEWSGAANMTLLTAGTDYAIASTQNTASNTISLGITPKRSVSIIAAFSRTDLAGAVSTMTPSAGLTLGSWSGADANAFNAQMEWDRSTVSPQGVLTTYTVTYTGVSSYWSMALVEIPAQ